MLLPKPRPYQVHIFLRKDFAEAAARHETTPDMQPLMDILTKHGASLGHSRLEQFSNFVNNVNKRPEILKNPGARKLYDLTANALANPEKYSYFEREFKLVMNKKMTFTASEANALLAELRTLGADSILTRGKAFRDGRTKKVRPVRKVYIPKKHPGM